MFCMISDIFSAFDPFRFISINKLTSILLITNLLIIISTQVTYWSMPNRSRVSTYLINVIINEQITRTYTSNLKGSGSIITPIFSMIIIINLAGLVPYTFSLSSHLIFTLSFGLPIWLSFILSTFSKAPKASVAHLLPDGAPDWLNPFLILIETTRILVRPLTLSFRLAANIRAGHIVLGLINIYAAAAIFGSFFTNNKPIISISRLYYIWSSYLLNSSIYLLLTIDTIR